MRLRLLLQTAALLAAAQAVLGGLGFLTRGAGWISLPLAALLLWLLWRTATILRTEIIRARRKEVFLVPWVTALLVVLAWQLPGLLLLPFWAPAWASEVWQGMWQWFPWALSHVAASGSEVVTPWLWLCMLPEGALFVWIASRPEPALITTLPRAAESLQAAGGDWAPARRFEDAFDEPRARRSDAARSNPG